MRRTHFREVKSSDSSTSTEKKSIVFLGNSIIKPVNSYEISKKLENCRVLIRSFPGSKVWYMKDHMEPSVREKPGHIILLIGTNDLNIDRAPDLIAKSIIGLAISMKSNSQNVSISNIIMRNDNLNEKAMEVNGHLK